MHSISSTNRDATAVSFPRSTCPALEDHCNQHISRSINVLPDEILLDIFEHYLSRCIRSPLGWSPQLSWYTLAHVSTRWREVIFASVQRLNLMFYCDVDRPGFNAELITLTPPIPLVLFSEFKHKHGFDRLLRCALQYWDRICQLVISGSHQVVHRFIAATPNRPASSLVGISIKTPHSHSELVSGDRSLATPLSSNFLRGLAPRLTHITLTDICLSIFPPMLFNSTHFVPLRTLTLRGMDPGSIPPSMFADALRAAPQLTRLVLHFCSDLSRSRDVAEGLLPATNEVIRLPSLDHLDYRGPSWWVEALTAARLETPTLDYVEAIIWDYGLSLLPNLSALVANAQNLRFDKAFVGFGRRTVDIRLSEEDHQSLFFEFCCTDFEDRTRSLSTLYNAIAGKLSTVRRMTLVSVHVPNPVPQPRLWSNLLLPLTGLRSLCVESTISPMLAQALSLSQAGGVTERLFPDLQRIVVFLRKVNGRIAGSDEFADPGPEVFVQYRDERKCAGQTVPILWGIDPDRCDWRAVLED
ncbi:hypothetical protein BC834DRAFT_474212 [Gloeopeniophorella convolvens]|nr:hypothetical protein BC834DRAFT_474212 [Gloeopeniophorella convolvens]